MHLQKNIILCTFIVLTLSCSKIDPIFNTQNSNSPKKLSKEQLALQEIEVEQMRQEAQNLLDSLRRQEQILNQKEIKLDSLQYALQMREIRINEKESSLTIMRIIAFVILFIGIILTITGALLLLKSRKRLEEKQFEKQMEKPAPVSTALSVAAVPVQEAAPVKSFPAELAVSEKPTPPVETKIIKQPGAKKTAVKKTLPVKNKPAAEKKQTAKPAQETGGREKLPAKRRKPKQTDSETA
jgi:hypothetical protein